MNDSNTNHPRPLLSEIHNRRLGTLATIIDAIEEATDAKCRMQLSRKKAIVITHSGVYDKMTRLSVATVERRLPLRSSFRTLFIHFDILNICQRALARSQISPNGHPIGHGYPEPIAQRKESTILDHKSEEEHLAAVVRDSAKLKTSEEFKGLLVRGYKRV